MGSTTHFDQFQLKTSGALNHFDTNHQCAVPKHGDGFNLSEFNGVADQVARHNIHSFGGGDRDLL